MTASVSYAHLLGSVPLADTEAVFRAVCAELGPHLRRIPDGETGERLQWVGFQRDMLLDHPAIEEDPDVDLNRVIQGDGVPLRLKPSADPDAVRFLTGYADAAAASYAVFARLQDAGVIDSGTRFQVCLPTPMSTAYMYISPAFRAAFMPPYERALLEALDGILSAIPHDRLSIQWDVCQEVQLFYDYYSHRPDDYKVQVYDLLARLGGRVPESVEMGYHMCYGSPASAPLEMPEDMGKMVEISNGVCERLDRRMDFLHIPVPRNRDAGVYFQPLRELNVPEGTELILGLIHYDDAEGDAARIAAAREFLPAFAVATECGWGRDDPSRVPGLLASHCRAIELLDHGD